MYTNDMSIKLLQHKNIKKGRFYFIDIMTTNHYCLINYCLFTLFPALQHIHHILQCISFGL